MMTGARWIPTGDLLVDASYLLAYFDQDATDRRFGALIGRMAVTAVNLGETFYEVKHLSGVSPIDVEQALDTLGVRVIDVDTEVARQFDHLKKTDAGRRLDQRSQGVLRQKIKSLSLGPTSRVWAPPWSVACQYLLVTSTEPPLSFTA